MSSGAHPHLRVQELFSVQGLSAVVTGGGSGIGLMCTLALVENGARVFITGRTQEKLDEVVKRYSGDGQERGQIIA
jgi:NADP-dependent 3-hydroxy acid dehydrogenase YdfG